jgi:hypothetical protein
MFRVQLLDTAINAPVPRELECPFSILAQNIKLRDAVILSRRLGNIGTMCWSRYYPSYFSERTESLRSSKRATNQNSVLKRQTPFGPPLIVPGRVLGVLGAPLVPVNSICYR